jgi:sec-independent protein translocase protein TatA
VSSPGAAELLIVLVIVLLILGPKRLPGLGRQLGGGIREFRKSFGGGSGASDEADRERVREDGVRPDLTSPTSSTSAASHVSQASPASSETLTTSSTATTADAGETVAGEADSERRSV